MLVTIITLQALMGGKGGAGPSSLHNTLEGPMEYVKMNGCKVYMDFNMVSNGSCVMVTWIIFKNYLMEVGLIQNRETIVLRMLTPVDFFYFIMNRNSLK